jgi:hypothetical protein
LNVNVQTKQGLSLEEIRAFLEASDQIHFEGQGRVALQKAINLITRSKTCPRERRPKRTPSSASPSSTALSRLFASDPKFLAIFRNLDVDLHSSPRLALSSERSCIQSASFSFDNRLHHRILEIAVQLPVGIVRLNHQDSHDLFFRVHPEMRPVSPVPSVAAR